MSISLKEITNIVYSYYSESALDNPKEDRATVVSNLVHDVLKESHTLFIHPLKQNFSHQLDTDDLSLRFVQHIFDQNPCRNQQSEGFGIDKWQIMFKLISETIVELSSIEIGDLFLDKIQMAAAFNSAYIPHISNGSWEIDTAKAKKIARSIMDGNLTILPLGYLGRQIAANLYDPSHALILIFCKGYYVICDSCKPKGCFRAFNIDPTLVTFEEVFQLVVDFYKFYALRDKSTALRLYYKHLPTFLSPRFKKYTFSDNICSTLEKFTLDFQNPDICSWASIALALTPSLSLLQLKKNSLTPFEETASRAHSYTLSLLTYTQFKILSCFAPLKNISGYYYFGNMSFGFDSISKLITSTVANLKNKDEIFFSKIKNITFPGFKKLKIKNENRELTAALFPTATLYDEKEWAKFSERQADYEPFSLLGKCLEQINKTQKSNEMINTDKINDTKKTAKMMLLPAKKSFLNLIYHNVWELSGKPQGDKWGEEHFLEDLNISVQAIEKAIMVFFGRFSIEKKNRLYTELYYAAGLPKTGDAQWGEHHFQDNLMRLADLMEEYTYPSSSITFRYYVY